MSQPEHVDFEQLAHGIVFALLNGRKVAYARRIHQNIYPSEMRFCCLDCGCDLRRIPRGHDGAIAELEQLPRQLSAKSGGASVINHTGFSVTSDLWSIAFIMFPPVRKC